MKYEVWLWVMVGCGALFVVAEILLTFYLLVAA